jgi:Tol biopolymer transport system component
VSGTKRLLALVVIVVFATGGVAWTEPNASGTVAFVRGRDIWVVRPDGTGARRLTNLPAGAFDSQISWSPDGTRLAYVEEDDGRSCGLPCLSLETISIDGTGEHPQAANEGNPSGPLRWAPDGTRIALVGWDGLTKHGSGIGPLEISDLVTGRSRVIAPRRLPRVPFLSRGYVVYDVAWSPDGSGICFSRESAAVSRLAYVRPDGTDLHLVPAPPADGCTWAPDSRTVAFASGTSVASIGIDGSDLHWLATGQSPVTAPTWSPDGRLVAFLRQEPAHPTRPWDLWTVVAATGEQARVATGVLGFSWSGDGKEIAFIVSSQPPATRPTSGTLWTAQADGSQPVELAAAVSEVDWAAGP